MSRQPRHRPAAPPRKTSPGLTVFALWALLAQIILPLGQAVPLPGGGDGAPRSMVICLANGGTRTVDGPGADGSRHRDAASHSPCTVCLAYGGLAHLALPDTATLPFPLDGRAVQTPPEPAALVAGLRTEPYQARAPPAA